MSSYTLNFNTSDTTNEKTFHSKSIDAPRNLNTEVIGNHSEHLLSFMGHHVPVAKFTKFSHQLSSLILTNDYKEMGKQIPLEIDILNLGRIIEGIVGKKPKEDATIKAAQIQMLAMLVLYDMMCPVASQKKLTPPAKMHNVYQWIKDSGLAPDGKIMCELREIEAGRQAVIELGISVNVVLKTLDGTPEHLTKPGAFQRTFPMIALQQTKFGGSTASTISEEGGFDPETASHLLNGARREMAAHLTYLLRETCDMTAQMYNARVEVPQAYVHNLRELLKIPLFPNDILQTYTKDMYKAQPAVEVVAKPGPDEIGPLQFDRMRQEVKDCTFKIDKFFETVKKAFEAAMQSSVAADLDDLITAKRPRNTGK